MRSCRLLTWRRHSLLLRALAGACCQLSIREADVVFSYCPFHHFPLVAARLVSVASASRMDQDEDLPLFVDAQAFSCVLVDYLVGTFDLDEVVSSPESSRLWRSSRPCVVGYLRRT